MSKQEPLTKYNHVDLLFPSKYLKAADLQKREIINKIHIRIIQNDFADGGVS